jgi:nitrate reductase NapAB chaperone NapD
MKYNTNTVWNGLVKMSINKNIVYDLTEVIDNNTDKKAFLYRKIERVNNINNIIDSNLFYNRQKAEKHFFSESRK